MIGDGDLEQIFESGDFDTAASFATTPTATVIQAWFTGRTDEVQMFGQVTIESQMPTLICPTAELVSGIAIRTAVTVNAVTYQVERIENLGTGVSVVYLKT